MIGIHLISHGEFSQGAVEALRMIAGNTEQVAYSILTEEDTVDSFRQKILEQSQCARIQGKVCLCLSTCSAQPPTTVPITTRNFSSRRDYQVIAGFNLPLLIEAVGMQPYLSLNELVLHLRKTVAETIVFQGDN
jgi:PTS system mannose-specific IIA component